MCIGCELTRARDSWSNGSQGPAWGWGTSPGAGRCNPGHVIGRTDPRPLGGGIGGPGPRASQSRPFDYHSTLANALPRLDTGNAQGGSAEPGRWSPRHLHRAHRLIWARLCRHRVRTQWDGWAGTVQSPAPIRTLAPVHPAHLAGDRATGPRMRPRRRPQDEGGAVPVGRLDCRPPSGSRGTGPLR
jgi:hypothetical protein